MNPSVTIIVACRNEAGHIRLFLESLLAQDMTGHGWEAIIADGMSSDGTREIIEEYATRGPVRCVDNPARIVSTGLNQAILEARGEFILRMDVHTEYAPDYVRRCLQTLLETGADNVGGPARTKARDYIGRAIAAAYHSRFACGGSRFHNEDHEGSVDTVPYGCWRKSTLERLGLFDESLIRNQDDELNLRTVRSGGRIWQSPRIVSWYFPRGNLRGLLHQYFQYGFWKIPVIQKHKLPASWRHLIPGLFVAVSAGLPLLAVVAGALGTSALAIGILQVWAGMLVLYGFVSALAAVFVARRHGWRLYPVLPLVFACYHVSYGAGFLAGLLSWPFRDKDGRVPDLFTKITRKTTMQVIAISSTLEIGSGLYF